MDAMVRLVPNDHLEDENAPANQSSDLKRISRRRIFCRSNRAKDRTMAVSHKDKLQMKSTSAGAAIKRRSSSGQFVTTELGVPLIAGFIDESGHVVVQRIVESFGISKGQLAETVGLGRETFHKTARTNAVKTQSRVREMLEIVSRISTWAGGKDQAMAWYRAQPIAAFGDRTAEALVKSGQAAAVRDYLDHLAMGGFA
jgi:hypothetical protein